MKDNMCVTFLVNENPEDLQKVWVHLKDQPRAVTSTYLVRIPTTHVHRIFGHRQSAVSLQDYLFQEIELFGTLVVANAFDEMAAINSGNIRWWNWFKWFRWIFRRWKWVIASVDGVIENDDVVEIRGIVEKYDLNSYESNEA